MAKLTTKEHLSKHDREIEAIRKLLIHGGKLLVKLEEQMLQENTALRKDIRELTAAQKRTDASLKAFIDSMRRGGNGHSTRAVN